MESPETPCSWQSLCGPASDAHCGACPRQPADVGATCAFRAAVPVPAATQAPAEAGALAALAGEPHAELRQAAERLAGCASRGANDALWREYRKHATPAAVLRLLAQLAAAEAQAAEWQDSAKSAEAKAVGAAATALANREEEISQLCRWNEQLEARAAKAEAQVAGLKQELGEQEVEKLALVRENAMLRKLLEAGKEYMARTRPGQATPFDTLAPAPPQPEAREKPARVCHECGDTYWANCLTCRSEVGEPDGSGQPEAREKQGEAGK